MMKKTDVLVIGGGTAGSIAAIQSARAGVKTVLVESNGMLGGTVTMDSVSYPGLFHAHGKQIIKGIGWDLILEAVRLNNDTLQDFSKPFAKSHTEHHIHINKDIFAMLLEEECLKAGVEIRFYETPVKVKFDGECWNVDIVGKGTEVAYRCSQLADCTGNASVARLAGLKCLKADELQPGSLMFKLCGYSPELLDYGLLQEKYDEALGNGVVNREVFFGDIRKFLQTSHHMNKRNTFSNHIANADSSTSVLHSRTNIGSRQSLLGMVRFLRTLPGLEKTTVFSMAPQTGVRETYRIDALHNITIDEYLSGHKYEDSICYAFYPVDVHDKEGVRPQRIKDGVFPEVPLRALIPKESMNMVVAGRCIGSDRKANSALRVQATGMATGQAAGAAVSEAFRRMTTPVHVPISAIRALLLENHAIIPPGKQFP